MSTNSGYDLTPLLESTGLLPYTDEARNNSTESTAPEAYKTPNPGDTFWDEETGQNITFAYMEDDKEIYFPEDKFNQRMGMMPSKMTREEFIENLDGQSIGSAFGALVDGFTGIMGEIKDSFDGDKLKEEVEAEGLLKTIDTTLWGMGQSVQIAIGDYGKIAKGLFKSVPGFAMDKVGGLIGNEGLEEKGEDLRYSQYSQNMDDYEDAYQDVMNKLEDSELSLDQKQMVMKRINMASLVLDPTILLGIGIAGRGASLGSKIGINTTMKAGMKGMLAKVPGGLTVAGKINHKASTLATGVFTESPTAYVLEKMGNGMQKLSGPAGRLAEKTAKTLENPRVQLGIGVASGGVTYANTGDPLTALLAGAGVGGGVSLSNPLARSIFSRTTNPNNLRKTGNGLFTAGETLKGLSGQVRTKGNSFDTMKLAAAFDNYSKPATAYGNMTKFLGSPLAVKAWAGATDITAKGLVLDGVTGFLATGTMEGTAQEMGEGILLANAGYFSTKGVNRAKNYAVRGGFLNLENSPEAQSGLNYITNRFIDTLDDQSSQDLIRGLNEQDPSIGRGVVDVLRHYSAQNSTNGQVMRTIFGDTERLRRVLAAKKMEESTGQFVDETSMEVALSDNAPDRISDLPREVYQDFYNQTDASMVNGASIGLTDNSIGETVPTIIMNTDQFMSRDKNGKITGINRAELTATLGHEQSHVMDHLDLALSREDSKALESIEGLEDVRALALKRMRQITGLEYEDGSLNENAYRDLYNALEATENASGVTSNTPRWESLISQEQKDVAMTKVDQELRADMQGLYHRVITGADTDSQSSFSKRLAKGGRQALKARDKLYQHIKRKAQTAEAQLAHLEQEKTALEMQGVSFDSLMGYALDGDNRPLAPAWARAHREDAMLDDGLMTIIADYTTRLDQAMNNPNINSDATPDSLSMEKPAPISPSEFGSPRFRQRNAHLFSADKEQPDGSPRLRSKKELDDWYSEDFSKKLHASLEEYHDKFSATDPDFSDQTMPDGAILQPVRKGGNPDFPDHHRGQFFTQGQLNWIEQTSGISSVMTAKLNEVNNMLLTDFGQVAKIRYLKSIKSGTKNTYGSIRPENKAVALQGFQISNQGNFLVSAVDMNQIYKDLNKEFSKKGKSKLIRELGRWKDSSGSARENVTAGIMQVLDNRMEGLPGASNGITDAQRNAVDTFLGIEDAQTVQGIGVANVNPDARLRKQSERAWKSYRIDRIDLLAPMDHPLRMPINHLASKTNFSVAEADNSPEQ